MDSIAAVRRSHELVTLARGALLTEATGLLAKREEPIGFEGWAHAMSIVSIDLWPHFSFRRRRIRAKGWRGPAVDEIACEEVRRRLSGGQVLAAGELGTPKRQGWGERSTYRVAADWLLWTGEASCTYRQAWRRVFVSTELAIPKTHQWDERDDAECIRQLARTALRALGIGTSADIADYYRLGEADVVSALRDLGAEVVKVEGWAQTAWLAPEASGSSTVQDWAVALSPFDSLVWYRPRQERLFGRKWLLEAYKPAAKREFGYFGMPILAGSHLAGRAALRRQGSSLIVEAAEWDNELADREQIDAAIERVADWTDTAIDWQTGVKAL